MEKRFREYLKHFEKLDYDVLSDEEINDEKGNLELKTGFLHRELVRILLVIVGALVCTSIFLSAALTSGNIACYIMAAVTAFCAAYLYVRYKAINGIIKQLEGYVDKLTML